MPGAQVDNQLIIVNCQLLFVIASTDLKPFVFRRHAQHRPLQLLDPFYHAPDNRTQSLVPRRMGSHKRGRRDAFITTSLLLFAGHLHVARDNGESEDCRCTITTIE